MKQLLKYMTLAAIVGMAGSFVARGAEDMRIAAQQTMDRFLHEDPGIKQSIDNSSGYVVFSHVNKGGFIFGGQHGEGIVYEKGQPVGKATVSGASFGALAGGASFDEIIIFKTPIALQDFKSGQFNGNTEVSGVGGNSGKNVRVKYVKGANVYLLATSGVMGDVSVGGQKFSFTPWVTQS